MISAKDVGRAVEGGRSCKFKKRQRGECGECGVLGEMGEGTGSVD